MKEQYRTAVLVALISLGLGFIFYFEQLTSKGF